MLQKLERSGFNHIAVLRATQRRLWRSMCDHDGIPADSTFAVFSDDNPFIPFHDKVLAQLGEATAAHRPGGGYVGLTIKDGRAVV